MSGPLSGVRVVDFTVALSGPLATMLLADQGADVVKVEPPGRGDITRIVGTKRDDTTAMFLNVNRGKRGIVVDMANPASAPLLDRLTASADVVAQNFRPGVAERLGIDYPTLAAKHPDLVYLSVTGFGTDGPLAGYRVWDNLVQAVSGMAATQGTRDGPTYIRQLICDKVTALTAAQAVTAALFARSQGAAGQHVQVSMLDASVAFLWPDAATEVTFVGSESDPPPPRTYDIIAHTDGWTTSSPITEEEFSGWCRALGAPELAADPRFDSHDKRLHHPEFGAARRQAQAAAASLSVAEALDRFAAEGVEAVQVSGLRDLPDHPQLAANGTVVQRQHPHLGPVREVRPPARFSATPTQDIAPAAPELGQHTDEVLVELGYDTVGIAELRAVGAVA